VTAHEVRVRQVWASNDKRDIADGLRQRLEILNVNGDTAQVYNQDTERRTSIRLERFKPTSTGYRLVSDTGESR
jgi:hypothetical protein